MCNAVEKESYMSLKLKWKPKPIFYCYGNAQRFADDSLTAKMTGEPLPKTWQEFLELTPEQKAQWDAELKLDAEYRIAEAQGFPNGIPGEKNEVVYSIFLHKEKKNISENVKKCKRNMPKIRRSIFHCGKRRIYLAKISGLWSMTLMALRQNMNRWSR